MAIPVQQRIDRMARWLRRENERPVIGFYVGSMYPLHLYQGSRRHLSDGPVTPDDVVVEDYLDDGDRLYDLHERAGGDLLWSAAPFFGIPWVEASLGCRVVADFTTGSTRASPPPGFEGASQIPTFRESNPWVARMLEFIPALQARSAGRYPVGVTLMRGISDLLSALYGGEGFIFRMLEHPEDIRSAVSKLTEYWIELGTCLLGHLPLYHGGTSSWFYGLWMPGKAIWMQEDAAALLSPRLYDEFILPADARIAGAFEHTIVHLHPARFIPAESLARTGIDAIELHVDYGGPTARDLLPVHREILKQKPLFIFGEMPPADIDALLEHLPWKGLALDLVVPSVEEAHRVSDHLQRILG